MEGLDRGYRKKCRAATFVRLDEPEGHKNAQRQKPPEGRCPYHFMSAFYIFGDIPCSILHTDKSCPTPDVHAFTLLDFSFSPVL
jgi:hypothetical protein